MPKERNDPKWLQDFAKAMLPVMSEFNLTTQPIRDVANFVRQSFSSAAANDRRAIQNLTSAPQQTVDAYTPVVNNIQGSRGTRTNNQAVNDLLSRIYMMFPDARK